MTMAIITDVSGLQEIDADNYRLVVSYALTDGKFESGPADISVIVTVGEDVVNIRDRIADAVEIHAKDVYGVTIGTFGSPVALGRRLFFFADLWEAL